MAQRAWRAGYHGLAAVIAVAWDTQLSPGDVRLLTAAQRAQDDQGSIFFFPDRSLSAATVAIGEMLAYKCSATPAAG